MARGVGQKGMGVFLTLCYRKFGMFRNLKDDLIFLVILSLWGRVIIVSESINLFSTFEEMIQYSLGYSDVIVGYYRSNFQILMVVLTLLLLPMTTQHNVYPLRLTLCLSAPH
jgi:hypothetical protein